MKPRLRRNVLTLAVETLDPVNAAEHLAFPDSVVSYFKGMMGQPPCGFPKDLQRIVLKGEKPITGRPGDLLPPHPRKARPHDCHYIGRSELSFVHNITAVVLVRKFFGKKVYKTMIPRNVRLSEAPSHRKPAIAYDKESKGARAYLHLAGELIKREEKAAKAAQEAAAAAAAEVKHG